MTDLDKLVHRVRDATVSRAAADTYVRELARWAEPPRRSWPVFAAGFAFAAAAAAIALLLWPTPRESAPATVAAPVRIGERVAIVADPGTSYRVVAATSDETRIAVDRGAVTARLWHGAGAHRLALEGGGVTATATGTVYSLAVGEHGAVVHVDEGTVEVRDERGTRAVAAGQTAGSGVASADSRAGAMLRELAAPPVPGDAAAPPATVPIDAPADTAARRDARVATTPPTPAPVDAAIESVKDRWHRVRLLRGQGQLDAAVRECLAIADLRDATWSPIALVEAVRIYVGPLADSERALALADRVLAEWPGDALADEARALRCRALDQLGRGAECKPATP
jgi:hypothetical protein